MLKPQSNRLAKPLMHIGMMTVSYGYFNSKIIHLFVLFKDWRSYEELMAGCKHGAAKSTRQNSKNDFKQKLHEDYEHSLFRLAAFYALEQEGEKLWREMEECQPEDSIYPSAEQMKRFKRQLDKELNRGKWTRRWQRLSPLVNTVAVIILVVTIVFFALVMNVEAVRHRVFNIFLTKETTSTIFQLEEESSERLDAAMEVSPGYWPGYMPEGYRLTKRETNGHTTRTVYLLGEDQYLSLTEVPPGAQVYLDSENAEREERIWINGHEGLLIEKGGHFTFTWSAHERIFTLRSELSLEEAVKVAESVGYQEN